MKPVRKVVFPVNGLGTRFLPATKAMPKEMLPVVDMPLIQYAVAEAAAAGITEMIFVTGRNKRAIEDHFDSYPELERELEEKGKDELLELVRGIVPAGVKCIYIRQPKALGLGHAVLCAKPVVGDEPFGVMLADDLVDAPSSCIGQLTAVREARGGGSVIADQDVAPEATNKYGIVSVDDAGDIHDHRGMGLVPDIFEEKDLQALPGTIAVGHVRYSTTGRPSIANAQPLLVNHKGMNIAIAHNGNLVNTFELRSRLEDEGAIFRGTSDTEVIMHLLVRELAHHDPVEAIRRTCQQLRGAYCLIFLLGRLMVAVRDPYGFHPLSVGRLDGAPIVASETCAFDLMDAEYEHCMKPGEMFIVDENGESTEMLGGVIPEKPKQCIFELIYFARPDSYVFNEQVYICRKNMGWQLAHESTPDVDFVMPFPDSGVYPAVGFAQCAELPYEHAMIRNHYVGRTFIQPSQSMRSFGVRVKINPVRAMIEGKRICIVDDSIVRGTTMITRVHKLRELGAKEVHIRISCPPIRFPCYYGIDFASPKELIAANHSLEEMKKMLDVDSLHYLSIEGLLRSVMHSDSYCLACFNGEYPVPPCRQYGKFILEKTHS